MEKAAAPLRTAAGASARRLHTPGSRGGDGRPDAGTAAPSDNPGRVGFLCPALQWSGSPVFRALCGTPAEGCWGKGRTGLRRTRLQGRLPSVVASPSALPRNAAFPCSRPAPPLSCILQCSSPPTPRLVEPVCCRSRALHPQAPRGQGFRSARHELRDSGERKSERGEARREAGGGAGVQTSA